MPWFQSISSKNRGEEFPSLNHEPEIEMSAMEIIKRWNYPVEEHKVRIGEDDRRGQEHTDTDTHKQAHKP